MTRSSALGILVGLCVGATAGPARAGDDGIYERLDGDLTVGARLGSELGRGRPHVAGQLGVHYFWSAGVVASYRDSLTESGQPARIASIGIDLRPLFLLRWPKDLEQGPAWLDLALDSWSLDVGSYFGWPGRDGETLEPGLEAGLGFGIPLSESAAGPWIGIRGLLGWPELSPHRSPWVSGLLTVGVDWLLESPWLAP